MQKNRKLSRDYLLIDNIYKNPEINLDKISLTEDFCLPNIELEVDGIGSYDSFSWWYDEKT